MNWTLSDNTNRIVIEVGIAYGSNVELARKALLKVARENEFVLEDPDPPQAVFREFGSSSLNFELRVCIKGMDHYVQIIDLLHTAIDAEFRKLKITIAFPQQDIHVRSVDQALPLEMKEGPAAGPAKEKPEA